MADSPQTPSKKLNKRPRYLTDAERFAIVAAVATGAVKSQLAQRFDVRPETISRLIRKVKSINDPDNPLAKRNYREMLRTKAIAAITDGLDTPDDAYKRANIGVKVLEGIGEFTTTHDQDVHIEVSWAGDAQSSESQAIDLMRQDVKQIPQDVDES